MPATSAAGRGRGLPAAPATATTIAEPEPYATDVRESDDEREHSVHTGPLRQRPHRSTRGHPLLGPPLPAAPRHLWTAVLGVRRRSAVERFRQSAAAPPSQRRPDPSDPIVSANRTSTRPGPGALALARARPRPGPAASALRPRTPCPGGTGRCSRRSRRSRRTRETGLRPKRALRMARLGRTPPRSPSMWMRDVSVRR